MKLTWFGGTTLRVHIGGRILVTDPDGAPEGVEPRELVSGADAVVALGGDLPTADPKAWMPRKAATLLADDGTLPDLIVSRLAPSGVIVDAVGEPPLLLVTGEAPAIGRWGRDAVVVVMGTALAATAAGVLDQMGPRLIAAAGAESDVDAVISAIGGRLDGTGLLSLEPGLALEV